MLCNAAGYINYFFYNERESSLLLLPFEFMLGSFKIVLVFIYQYTRGHNLERGVMQEIRVDLTYKHNMFTPGECL